MWAVMIQACYNASDDEVGNIYQALLWGSCYPQAPWTSRAVPDGPTDGGLVARKSSHGPSADLGVGGSGEVGWCRSYRRPSRGNHLDLC
jgi:hypothetical protein